MKILCQTCVVAAALSGLGFAQGQAGQPGSNKHSRERGKSVTGCLSEEQGAYRLQLPRGEPVVVEGTLEFQKHLGHTVRLEGAMNEQGGQKVFAATSLQHVAANCNDVQAKGEGRRSGLTAEDQGGSEADRQMTATIRKAIVDDDSLSTAAHNVKIITRSGMVTLKGRVPTQREKDVVDAKAKAIAGNSQVRNDLQIDTSGKGLKRGGQ